MALATGCNPQCHHIRDGAGIGSQSISKIKKRGEKLGQDFMDVEADKELPAEEDEWDDTEPGKDDEYDKDDEENNDEEW